MLLWHIVLLPLIVSIVIAIHVLLVRRRGVVPPFAPAGAVAGGGSAAGEDAEPAPMAATSAAPTSTSDSAEVDAASPNEVAP
jgi:hypothetical protein